MPCLAWEETAVKSAIPSLGRSWLLSKVYGGSACDRDWIFYNLFVVSFYVAFLFCPLVVLYYKKELQQRNEELLKRNEVIRVRDAQILKRNKDIQIRDAQILRCNKEIRIRDAEILKCNKEIRIRDEKILKCNRDIRNRDEKIRNCNHEIQMLKEQIETPKCIICWDKDVSMVFSCGHAITCEDCADPRNLRDYGSKCFKCAKPITAVTKLYY